MSESANPTSPSTPPAPPASKKSKADASAKKVPGGSARGARHVAPSSRRPSGAAPVLGGLVAVASAGILGALFRGHGYVPLNPVFPPDRNAGDVIAWLQAHPENRA